MPRVLIIIEGGVMQDIIAEREDDVEILIKDYDTDGVEDDQIDVRRDKDGDLYAFQIGPHSFSESAVKKAFDEIE